MYTDLRELYLVGLYKKNSVKYRGPSPLGYFYSQHNFVSEL